MDRECWALVEVLSMPTGKVKWFDPKKGFGFIHGPAAQDVFVHYSHITSDGFRALKDGEWVDYELIEGDKGWQARSVQQIAENNVARSSLDHARTQRHVWSADSQ